VLLTLLAVDLVLLGALAVGIARVRMQPAGAVVVAPSGSRRIDEMTKGPVILVFLTTTCTTCGAFWRSLEAWGATTVHDARIVVVTRDEDGEQPRRVRELAPRRIPVVMSSDAWSAYGVARAPHFAYVDREEVIVSGAASSWDDVVSACRPSGERA
jgi:hypothetical protein